MQNYIFLDIDGVLNKMTDIFLDKTLVSILAEIVKETNAEIILISSWKEDWSKNKMENRSFAKAIDDTFNEFGISVTDKTEDNNSWRRGKGISDFLINHPAKNWIILDDEIFPDYDKYECKNHLIQTNPSLGITEEEKKDAIQMLKG